MNRNKKITAIFQIKTYSLTYKAGNNGTVNGVSTQTVSHGENGTPVTAVANNGYVFVRWSDNRTDNPRTDTNVTEDISVTAIFSPTTPTATLSGNSNICYGEPAILELLLTGIGPWEVVYTDGINQFELTDIMSSPYTFSVFPETSKTYTLGTVKDRYNNSGSVSGIATIKVDPLSVGGEGLTLAVFVRVKDFDPLDIVSLVTSTTSSRFRF